MVSNADIVFVFDIHAGIFVIVLKVSAILLQIFYTFKSVNVCDGLFEIFYLDIVICETNDSLRMGAMAIIWKIIRKIFYLVSALSSCEVGLVIDTNVCKSYQFIYMSLPVLFYTQWILTHWGHDEMGDISQETFSNAFPEWKYMNFD